MAARSFTTFQLNEELFGIDILQVREINKQMDMTVVPHAPEYIRGLINLRGQIVTIFDLTKRIGLEVDDSKPAHVIILKTESEMQNLRGQDGSEDLVFTGDKVGLLVDEIGDVVTVPEENIDLPPANVGKIDGQYLSGVIKLDNSLISVISLQKVLGQTEN